MRRLTLTSAAAVLSFFLLAAPAWGEWVWPLRGEVITPYRNGADPYASGQHRGIDIAGDAGAPVVAASGGEVRFAGTAGSSGLTVSVRTADGRYDTSYLHLSAASVRRGDRVAAGQRIGAVGSTGVRSAEPAHLHFGVRDAGSRHAYHDPLGFLPPASRPQPPREAPAPHPAPAPVAPAPAPAPEPSRPPAGRGAPARALAPRRVPGRVPDRAPARRGHPVRAPVPIRSPAADALLAGEPAPQRVGDFATRSGPAPIARPAPRPTSAAGPGAASRPNVERATPRGDPGRSRHGSRAAAGRGADPGDSTIGVARSPAAASGSGSGPDHGLLLACLGLLAAAAMLGVTGDRQEAGRRTSRRVARLFQPLVGRR